MITRLRFFTLICVFSFPILVRAQGVTTVPIDRALGRSGQKTGDVYKVSFPRVISELQAHKISVTALHSHMLTEQPRLFFMHFWAVGSPDSVGAGIAAALKKISIK